MRSYVHTILCTVHTGNMLCVNIHTLTTASALLGKAASAVAAAVVPSVVVAVVLAVVLAVTLGTVTPVTAAVGVSSFGNCDVIAHVATQYFSISQANACTSCKRGTHRSARALLLVMSVVQSSP
jgi:hypothetical protein